MFEGSLIESRGLVIKSSTSWEASEVWDALTSTRPSHSSSLTARPSIMTFGKVNYRQTKRPCIPPGLFR
jgi:hypothetical protein